MRKKGRENLTRVDRYFFGGIVTMRLAKGPAFIGAYASALKEWIRYMFTRMDVYDCCLVCDQEKYMWYLHI